MKSVRITASGAVALALLSFGTAPVSACDDRFFKQCEAEVVPSPEADAPMVAVRRRPAHLRAAVPRWQRQVQRTRAPHPAAPLAPETEQATQSDPGTQPLMYSSDVQPAETPLSRRFRGFIDPQSMTVNSFEALRKPRLDAEHLTPAPTMPPGEANDASADDGVPAEAAVAPIAAAEPAVATPAAADVRPPASLPVATATATQVQVSLASNAPPAGDAPSRFPIHQLVFALCGALGVASALRFIVGT